MIGEVLHTRRTRLQWMISSSRDSNRRGRASWGTSGKRSAADQSKLREDNPRVLDFVGFEPDCSEPYKWKAAASLSSGWPA